MKKFLSLLALMCLFCTGAWAEPAFRYHRYDTFKSTPIKSNSIVFVGNSITNMHPWIEAFGNDPRIVNRGCSGGLSSEILANVRSYCVGHPAKIFLMIGINDNASTSAKQAEVANNILNTVTQIRTISPTTKVYVQSILPCGHGSYPNSTTLATLNTLIQQLLTQNYGSDDHVTYVDVYSQLLNKLDTRTSGGITYSYDALHMTAAGYQIWTNKLLEYLAEDGISAVYPSNTGSLQYNPGAGTDSFGARCTYFSMLPISSNDVLFFGDEMVHGGEWHELLGNANVKNRGTNWTLDGTAATITRTGYEIDATFHSVSGVTKNAPKQVLLYTGTGEVNGTGSLNTILNNYKALVTKIRNYTGSSTKISLVSLMPTTTAGNTRVKDFNDLLRSYAYDETNVEYIDIYTPLSTNDNVNTSYFPASNNYLYGEGYVVVANELAKSITGCTPVTAAKAKEYRDLVEGRSTGGTTEPSDVATEITEGWYQIEIGSGTGFSNYHQQYKGKYINSDYRVSGSFTWAMGLTDDKTDYRTYVYVSGSENAYNIQFNRGGYSTYAPFYAANNCTKTASAPNSLYFIPNGDKTEWKIWGNNTNRWMGWDLNGPSVGSSSTPSTANDNNYFVFHKVDATPVVPEVGKRYKACVLYSNGTKKYFTSSGFSESADAAEVFNVQASNNASYPYIFVGESGKCLTSSGAQSVTAGDGRTLMKYGDMATVAASNSVTMPASMRLGKIYLTAKQRYSNTNLEGCIIVNMSSNAYDNSTAPYMNGTYTSAIILEEVPCEDEEFFEEGWYQIQVGNGNYQAHSTYKGQYIYSNPHYVGTNNWAMGVTTDNTDVRTYVYITGSHDQWHIEFNHGTSDAHYTTTNALYATTPCNLSFVPNTDKTQWKIKNASANQYWMGWNLNGPSIGAATEATITNPAAQCYFVFTKVDEPLPHDPINVTYTFTVDGKEIGSVVREETTNGAPTITNIIPEYVNVESGMPAKVTEGAYTIETSYKDELGFVPGKKYIIYFKNGSNYYYWHYDDSGVGNEIRRNGTPHEITTREELDNYGLAANWRVGGDWFNGFTFLNCASQLTLTKPATLAAGAAFLLDDAEATRFVPVKQSTGRYRFYIKGQDVFYLAHTSHGSHRITMYNVSDYSVGDNTGGASVCMFEEVAGPDLDALQEKIDDLFRMATGPVAYQKIGYPRLSAATVTELYSKYEGNHGGVNDANYDAASAAYDAVLAETDVNLPEDGKAYYISAVHVGTDGTIADHQYVYSNAEGQITTAADAKDNQTYNVFIAKRVGNGVVLVNELGNYLCWFDGSNSTKSYNTKGAVETYDATYNVLTIEHANTTNTNNNGAVNSLTNLQRFGMLQISGKPKNSTTNQYLVVDAGNNDAKHFVSGNPGNKFYGATAHTFLFYFEEVENPNIVKLTNPNSAGNSSLDGKFVGTFSAPYNVELTNGVKAYTGVLSSNGEAVIFTEIGTIVPKNTGVLVYAENASDAISDFAIPAATADIPAIAAGANIFLPTGRTGATLQEGDLILGKGTKGVGFYKVNPAKPNVARNKAYIPAGDAASAARFVFDFDVDGTLTGVDGVETCEGQHSVYDLQGRRVQNAQKGLYIVNGKKVVR